MKLEKLRPVFHVLLLLWIRAAQCLLEPPANVTISCGNVQNTIHWSYDQLVPGLRFKVEIKEYYSPTVDVRWVDSPALQADLSEFSALDKDYLAWVTAVLGTNKSVSSYAPPYTYSIDSPSPTQCSLDMPPVNVTALHDDMVEVRFEHPWLWYNMSHSEDNESKRRKRKRHNAHHKEIPKFEYVVTIVGQDHEHHLNCVKSLCNQRFPVLAGQEKHCLRISGELQGAFVGSTQTYCATALIPAPTKDNTVVIAVVVVVFIVCVTAFILYMLYKKKTSPGTELPNSFSIRGNGTSTMGVEQTTVLTVDASSPTPLLDNEDGTSSPTAAPFSESDDFRCRIGGMNAEGEGPDVAEAERDEGQEYRRANGLEEDEPQAEGEAEAAGYEQRPTLIDMGSGDMVEGYRRLTDDSG